MATERITVTGIRPLKDSIGPPGHHLRWAFPEQFGFPAKGFVIYRRRSGGFKSEGCLDLTKDKVPTGRLLASGSSLEGVIFSYPDAVQIRGNGENLTVNPPSPNLLELRFAEPMAFLSIEVDGVQGPVQLRAYAGSQLVSTSPPLAINSRSLEVAAPYITQATIPLNFHTLVAICHLSMDADCKNRSWESIAKLPLLKTVDEGLARLEADLRNRYAPDRDRAIQRYKPKLEELIKWLTLLQNPTDPTFVNPGASPDQLQLPASESQSPLQSIRPQAMLLLAALDPNIARFLSLYWVDTYGAPNGPKAGTSYDYKVEGLWQGHEVGCGLVFGLGAKEAGLPFVEKPLKGNQLPGLRWQGNKPLGRVGLRWPRPKEGQGAVQPIFFDLLRASGTGSEEFLTAKLPVLVPATAWENDDNALFVDTDAPLGSHRYRLQAIDLFGQVGKAVESEPIAVKDLEAPPPPVRLRALLTQPGYPWRTQEDIRKATEPATLDLQFEYGDAQHRQAPDAESFRLYWRAESLFASESVAVHHVSSQVLKSNLRTHTVQVQGSAGLDLESFVGGKLARESATDNPLPAAERHHYQIARRLQTDRLRLAPSENQFVDGRYQLIADPRLRSNWTELNLTVPGRQPLQRLVRQIGVLQASATKVETLTPRSDPLAMLPAGHRPPTLAEPPPIVEVELDRRLLEPDLFTGGALMSDGQSHPILYSAGGLASPTRIGLPPGTTISPGATLTLKPAQPFAGTIQQIERLPGGGLAITLRAQANPAGAAHLKGSVLTIEGQKLTVLQAWEEPASLRLELRSLGVLPATLDNWLGKEARVIPPLVQALTIQGTVPNELAKAPGGEIAFDDNRGGQSVTYVARVVSDIKTGPNTFNLLVRLSPTAQAALRPNSTHCRYYAPYRQELKVTLPTTVGSADPVTTLALSMSADQSSKSIYLAVTTNDVRGNQGPLSSPVQVTAVKPPPTGAPSQPYPCGFDVTTEAGYATPPDRQGRATLCLAWDVGTLSATTGLRYEVARALDNTILATHRRNWLLGGPSLQTTPVATGTLDNVTFEETRGLYPVELTANLGEVKPTAFRGGRLSQNGRFFQITTIAAGSAGTAQLILRPMGQNKPTTGTATIERPPNYDAVRDDVDALRQLAAANPDAFSLVTGVPIPNATDQVTGVPLRETRFRDEVPGVGHNRFFYRVRAVDAAESRSEWSEVSVAFHQVDTSVPRTPSNIRATSGIRSAALRWPVDSSVHLYAIHRASSPAELASVIGREPLAVIEAAGDEEAPFEVVFRNEPLDPLSRGDTYLYRVVAMRSVRTGPDDADRVVVSSAPSEVVRATPVDPDPPESPDDLFAERVSEAEASVIRLEWSATARLEYLVRRRLETSSTWTAASDWLEGGELSGSAPGWSYNFVDEVPVPERTVYQVVMRNHAGRTAHSNEADPV